MLSNCFSFSFFLFFARYIHQSNWDEARRVAETNDPESLVDVLIGQVHSSFLLFSWVRTEGI